MVIGKELDRPFEMVSRWMTLERTKSRLSMTVRAYVDAGQYQAWDPGIAGHVAVDSAGKFIEVANARPDRYWNK